MHHLRIAGESEIAQHNNEKEQEYSCQSLAPKMKSRESESNQKLKAGGTNTLKKKKKFS